MTNRKKVLISGWYGFGNAGDEAILRTFIDRMSAHAAISVLTVNPARISQDYPEVEAVQHSRLIGRDLWRLLFGGELLRYIKQLWQMDLFVFGGGGIVKESVGWRIMSMNLDEIWLAKCFGKPVALYALGISPLRSSFKRWVYGQTFRRCDLIAVRDKGGARVLEEIGVPPERIVIVADPVFVLEPRPPQLTPELEEIVRRAETGETLALSVGLAFKPEQGDESIRALARMLDQLHERHGVDFCAVPMRVIQDEFDDRQMAAWVRSFMRHPGCLQSFEHSLPPEQTMWLMSRFRFCIAARLHAAIFSLATGVPAVAINCDRYDPKVRMIMEEAGCGDWVVDADDRLAETLLERAESCLSDLPGCRARIQGALPGLTGKAMAFFKQAQALLRA
jgi:polysaccharide pyruvyl transferase CsaB